MKITKKKMKLQQSKLKNKKMDKKCSTYKENYILPQKKKFRRIQEIKLTSLMGHFMETGRF